MLIKSMTHTKYGEIFKSGEGVNLQISFSNCLRWHQDNLFEYIVKFEGKVGNLQRVIQCFRSVRLVLAETVQNTKQIKMGSKTGEN